MARVLKTLATAVVEASGAALHETGQSLQRLGLRTAGNHVLKPDPFVLIGPKKPLVVPGAVTHPSATILGDVTVYTHASVGENSVLRADKFPVNIGRHVKIGKGCVLSSSNESVNGLPPSLEISEFVTIGDNTVVETSMIANHVTIGDDCVVSEGCIIHPRSVIKAGTVLPPNHVVPADTIWEGNPAKFVGDVVYH